SFIWLLRSSNAVHSSTEPRILVAGLLITTIILKLYGSSISAVPRLEWFAQPWLQISVLQWSHLFGLVLLSGISLYLSATVLP
ncbi:MAG: hypothetical protein R3B84_17740, partial [Zavarzinella sp.]